MLSQSEHRDRAWASRMRSPSCCGANRDARGTSCSCSFFLLLSWLLMLCAVCAWTSKRLAPFWGVSQGVHCSSCSWLLYIFCFRSVHVRGLGVGLETAGAFLGCESRWALSSSSCFRFFFCLRSLCTCRGVGVGLETAGAHATAPATRRRRRPPRRRTHRRRRGWWLPRPEVQVQLIRWGALAFVLARELAAAAAAVAEGRRQSWRTVRRGGKVAVVCGPVDAKQVVHGGGR